jgi:hypothetical protein
VVLDDVHLHRAWSETTLGAFTIDLAPSATFFTVCVDVDGGPLTVCTTINSSTAGLAATPASQDVTTYHDPDTGAVTIVSAASINLDSNAISIDDPDGDGNPDTVDITTAIPVSFSLTANIVGGSLVFTGGSVNVGPPGTITVADTDSTANVAITASVPGASIPDTPLDGCRQRPLPDIWDHHLHLLRHDTDRRHAARHGGLHQHTQPTNQHTQRRRCSLRLQEVR